MYSLMLSLATACRRPPPSVFSSGSSSGASGSVGVTLGGALKETGVGSPTFPAASTAR